MGVSGLPFLSPRGGLVEVVSEADARDHRHHAGSSRPVAARRTRDSSRRLARGHGVRSDQRVDAQVDEHIRWRTWHPCRESTRRRSNGCSSHPRLHDQKGGADRRSLCGHHRHHDVAVLQLSEHRQRQLWRRRAFDHLDAGLGQPCGSVWCAAVPVQCVLSHQPTRSATTSTCSA